MAFKIIRNDITKVEADAVVNTANPDVTYGDGVDAAIYEAAGKDLLLEARRKIGELLPGEVAITPAFNLPAKYIIHSSGPWYRDGKHGEPEILRSCYDKALELAYENGCKSIAFPLMATGTYGFPEELGLQISIDAFTAFLIEHDMDIILVVYGDSAYKISRRIFGQVESFIGYSNVPEEKSGLSEISAKENPENSVPLENRLRAIYKESFSKYLNQIIEKKGLKKSEVYAAADISKQYFSKLLKGQVNPSKEKVLALSVGLRLSEEEAAELLKIAGYSFSPISQVDIVVQYFLQKKDYSVIKLDMVLFDYGLPLLSD